MFFKSIIYLSLFVQCYVQAFTQDLSRPIWIKGQVVDSVKSDGINGATITLSFYDSSIVRNRISQSDGSFVFDSIKQTRCKLQVNALGYYTASVDILNNGKDIDLGKVKLIMRDKNLKEVVVTAKKPLIQQEIDRIVYNVE